MIEVQITDGMLTRAQQKADEMGKLNKSITGGKGNLAGFIGEEVVHHALGGGEIVNTHDYDFILNNIMYDVKTKRCKDKPLLHYECSVAAMNTVQKCDRYIFVRVEYNKQTNELGPRAWILGWYDKKEYFDHARYLRKGQRDGDNWFTVKANCYNIPIEALRPIDEIK